MSDNQVLRAKIKVLPEFRASLKSLDVRSLPASEQLVSGSDISSPVLVSPPAIKSSTIYEHVPHTQGAAMTYVTESLLDARLEAAEARTEARIARLEVVVDNSIKNNEAAVSRIEKALRVFSADTKQAIDGLRFDNQQAIDGLRSDNQRAIDGLRFDNQRAIDGLRSDTKQAISELRADNKYTRTTVVVIIITSFIALLIGLGGLMAAMQSNSMTSFFQGAAFKDVISTEVLLQNQSLNNKVEAVEAKLDTLIETISRQ
ncbi:Uncharacterised protein [Oligella ureolytica]|uniref:hypothetical protein n=1 Tax=Oligella ureolytica TaxID=90244 RepID=UPI000DFC046F|nr:hypothetical protein [Oligella ureolytica]SUA55926.1 Uncharacterised protein [Oligella ureolytica]